MQSLDEEQIKQELQELKPKVVSEQTRKKILPNTQPKKSAVLLGVAASIALLVGVAGVTWSFMKQSPSAHTPSLANNSAIQSNKTNRLASTQQQSQRQVFSISDDSGQIIYIKGEPHRKVTYLDLNKQHTEVDGKTVQVIHPRETQYLVPISTF